MPDWRSCLSVCLRPYVTACTIESVTCDVITSNECRRSCLPCFVIWCDASYFSRGSDYTTASSPPAPPQYESRPTTAEQRLGGSSHQGHTSCSTAHQDIASQEFPRGCGIPRIDQQSHLGATVSTLLPAASGAIGRLFDVHFHPSL